MIQKRQTAVRIWISNLMNGKYVKQPGEFEPNYVEVNGKKIGRVNLVGTVVYKFESEDNNYVSLTIDDGSYQIRLKVWKEGTKLLRDFNSGDFVNIIGKPREYNEELYIIPEIVKKMEDLNWELVWKTELFKEYGKPEKIEIKKHLVQQTSSENKSEIEEEHIEENSSKVSVLNVINKFSHEEGIKIDVLSEKCELDYESAENIVNELLKEGEIYEARPGVFKTIG